MSNLERVRVLGVDDTENGRKTIKDAIRKTGVRNPVILNNLERAATQTYQDQELNPFTAVVMGALKGRWQELHPLVLAVGARAVLVVSSPSFVLPPHVGDIDVFMRARLQDPTDTATKEMFKLAITTPRVIEDPPIDVPLDLQKLGLS